MSLGRIGVSEPARVDDLAMSGSIPRDKIVSEAYSTLRRRSFRYRLATVTRSDYRLAAGGSRY